MWRSRNVKPQQHNDDFCAVLVGDLLKVDPSSSDVQNELLSAIARLQVDGKSLSRIWKLVAILSRPNLLHANERFGFLS